MGSHCEMNETKIKKYFAGRFFEIYLIRDSIDFSKFGQKSEGFRPTRK